MKDYIIRRLLLLPLTLFAILLVNFVIINMAPGDPVSVTEISQGGAASRRAGGAGAFGSDMRYLLFREHYGLTLPVLFNTWPLLSQEQIDRKLKMLAAPGDTPFKEVQEERVRLGDQARYAMPQLLHAMNDPSLEWTVRLLAMHYVIRGGTRMGYVGPNLSPEKRKYNKETAAQNQWLRERSPDPFDSREEIERKMAALNEWATTTPLRKEFTPSLWEKVRIFFLDTRFVRYFSRVLTLDFGTLRDDTNKTVISEVTKRFKYSLTLSVTPLLITFFLCMIIGFTMAFYHNRWLDHSLNVTCLVLYALPIFVAAPFLIEKVALNHDFPFTNIPIPISGFTSPERIYSQMTSAERLADIARHIFLPIVAILYGSLATQSRLARTAALEVMRQDFVRTARAKGAAPLSIATRHVGRAASITIVTSIAGSLGVVLGGSLIVETLFEIDGFGKFFYDAVINRDYNVILFSAIAGSFLTLLGYLVSDIAYTVLDPRVELK